MYVLVNRPLKGIFFKTVVMLNFLKAFYNHITLLLIIALYFILHYDFKCYMKMQNDFTFVSNY